MFTGIIRNTAKLISIIKKPNFHIHTIELPYHMLEGLETGASIAHNGCCLTVTKINDNYISFDLIKETLKITNLSKLVIGDKINIERAAKFNDEIGGHLMSGHIIGTAKIIKIFNLEKNYEIWFRVQDLTLMKYIFYKGFIGIDGVSLTVGKILTNRFCVYIIPETLQRTNFSSKKIGELVNIEVASQAQIIIDTIERFWIQKKQQNPLWIKRNSKNYLHR